MLDRLAPRPGSRRPLRRMGRGTGSGRGRTCGRGQKGAGARSGHKQRPGYEGGQMPLVRRIPKMGFTNIFREEVQVVNVKDLGRFPPGAVLDAAALAGERLIARADRPVKILAKGELTVAITLRVDAASEAARKKVEAAGGRVEIVRAPRRRGRPESS